MSKIDQFRKIVETRAHGTVEGTHVDLFSANAVVTVYDGLNEANREKYVTFAPHKMVSMAFKLVK